MPDTRGVGNDHEQYAQMLEQRFGIDPGRLAELVTDAWRMRAPTALAGDLGEAGGLPGGGRG